MITKKKLKKKPGLQKTILEFFLTITMVGIISFLVSGNIKLFQKKRRTNEQYFELKKEIQNVEGKNKELKTMFYQASQREYLERLIREKGLYKKPGEKVIVIEGGK